MAANGEVLLTSERYGARSSAETGIASVRENARHDAQYDRLVSGSQFYFTLRARNGEVLGTSEMYPTRSACEGGIGAVKRSAADAGVEVAGN